MNYRKKIGILIFLPLWLSCHKPVFQLNGKWGSSGQVTDSVNSFRWYLEYSIDGNSYIIEGYPPIYEEGNFEILEYRQDTLEILFMPRSGTEGKDNYKKTVIISAQDKLIMEGKEFLKIGTK